MGSRCGASSEGRRHLQTVVASAKRMERLIEDLLAFSRLGRQPLSKQALRFGDLLRDVLDELQKAQAGPAGWKSSWGACRIARAMLLC